MIVPDWPAPPNVRAFATTRDGGRSVGAYRSFNLADHVGDDLSAVTANRELLRSGLPAAPNWLKQVHGVRCVDAARQEQEADAAFTDQPGRVCAVLTADCLPVLFCDEGGTKVAAAHAGWRGLAAGVLEATVAAMDRPPARLMAWLGPGIGPLAFEVGPEVRAAFMQTDGGARDAFVARGDKWLCDLYALARRRLRRIGMERVSGGDFCTFAERERFFSYRRDGITGRMASVIWLEP